MAIYEDYRITSDGWIDLNTTLGIPVGTAIRLTNTTSEELKVIVSSTSPSSTVSGKVISNTYSYEPYVEFEEGLETIWVKGNSAKFSIVDLTGRGTNLIPSGVYTGTRAMTVQSYVEANIKNGVQFEGSTLISALDNGESNDTIFLTGNKPVVLKARNISYTGDGVVASIYQSPTYTLGTSAPYQNPNTINPVTGLSSILVGATITDDGELIFAPIYHVGNTSRQGRGATDVAVGGERILKPDTPYLLRLTGIGTAQNVSSFLSWYEGNKDLPLNQ